MRLRNQNLGNDESHWSPEDGRQAVWFWIFWSIYVCLATFLIVALITDWPAFLHEPLQYFR